MPLLETPRLILRPLAESDLHAYHHAVYGDPQVMVYMPGGVPRPMERTAQLIAEFRRLWEEYGYGVWGLVHKADNRLIGHAGLYPLPSAASPALDVEIMYAIARSYWGRGLTTEAARAVLEHGFTAAGLDRIIALAVPENVASRRVMEKIGMTHLGITDRYYNTPLACYALDRRQFVKLHPPLAE